KTSSSQPQVITIRRGLFLILLHKLRHPLYTPIIKIRQGLFAARLAALVSILFIFGFTRAMRLVLPQHNKSKINVKKLYFALLQQSEIIFSIPLNSINQHRNFLVKRLSYKNHK
ncbi:MAG: hypothetical protein ACRC01_12570, partial [Deefgea sp.]